MTVVFMVFFSLSSESSCLTQTNVMPFLTASINLFGRPPDFLPASYNLIILLLTYSPSLLCTCPNHLSLTFSPKHLMCSVPLMSSFLIHPSSSVQKRVSKPYIISAVTSLYTFPLTLCDTLLSHITPDAFSTCLHSFLHSVTMVCFQTFMLIGCFLYMYPILSYFGSSICDFYNLPSSIPLSPAAHTGYPAEGGDRHVSGHPPAHQQHQCLPGQGNSSSLCPVLCCFCVQVSKSIGCNLFWGLGHC